MVLHPPVCHLTALRSLRGRLRTHERCGNYARSMTRMIDTPETASQRSGMSILWAFKEKHSASVYRPRKCSKFAPLPSAIYLTKLCSGCKLWVANWCLSIGLHSRKLEICFTTVPLSARGWPAYRTTFWREIDRICIRSYQNSSRRWLHDSVRQSSYSVSFKPKLSILGKRRLNLHQLTDWASTFWLCPAHPSILPSRICWQIRSG